MTLHFTKAMPQIISSFHHRNPTTTKQAQGIFAFTDKMT